MDPMKMHWSHELHQAASNGDPVNLQHLLEQGYPPDTEGGLVCSLRGASELNTRTPLHYSAKEGHLQCLRLLLQYGANPNVRDNDGYSPIHYVCQIHNPSADISKNVRLCLQSLEEFGADTKARTNSGHTPLTLARQHRNKTCVNHLLAQGNAWVCGESLIALCPCRLTGATLVGA